MKTNIMKTFRLFLLCFFLPLSFYGQKTLTGLWTGTLSNDSSTIRKDQSFEIVLTQYKQNVYGYSRSTFIVNDTLYYIMKRVKGKIADDVCEIKDDEIISFNFRGKIDKGVKVTTTFRMNRQDSSWYLAGDWSTNKTKRFYSISGKVDLKDEPDLEKSKILPHLEELNLAKDIPFYAEAKNPAPEPKTVAVVSKKEPVTRNTVIKKEEPVVKPAETIAQPEKSGPVASIKPVEKKENTETKKEEPVVVVNKPEPRTNAVQKDLPAKKQEVITKPSEPPASKQEPVVINKPTAKPVTEIKKEEPPVAIIPETEKPKAPVVEKKPVVAGAALVNQRKTAPPQEVNFRSDSLQLALYDNGEIDGDTVSVLLNGEILLTKQGLKASAIKKTIYIAPGTNEVVLVLYAENLGKYAPNTGLLVVYDGEERYQVRFSADLQQNASVIFRRKK